MHWRVRLDDQHGRFWLQSDHKWSDCKSDGKVFATEAEAVSAAISARTNAAKTSDWFPKIKVIVFKEDR